MPIEAEPSVFPPYFPLRPMLAPVNEGEEGPSDRDMSPDAGLPDERPEKSGPGGEEAERHG